MFFYYSSDHCVEYRPWFAYLTFPAFVIAAFALTAEGPMPEVRNMLFVSLVAISGLVVLALMIAAFFVLWTFGKAVCSKVGNCMYIITLALSLGLGAGVIAAFGEDSVYLLSWLVHCLAGMFLVFCPNTSVDCFIIIPPFKTFSINGFVAVIIWLVVDLVFCICLGWGINLFWHLLSLSFGVLWATALLRLRYISEGTGDQTLWQWIKGGDSDEDASWDDSWSIKSKMKDELEHKQEDTDELLKEKDEDFIKKHDLGDNQETTSVLCKCGQIIHTPIKFEGKSIKCHACNHVIHVPRLDEFN